MSRPLTIPRIDISAFSAESPGSIAVQEQVATQLSDACERYGFFHVVGHDYSTSQQQGIFRAHQEFFDLDTSAKSQIPIKSGGFTRGYVGVGGESGSDLFELKEAFSYGYKWTGKPNNPLQGPNEWPPPSIMAPDWQPRMEGFYDAIVDIAESTNRALSLSLGYGTNHLGSYCKEGDTISLMRFFNYLPAHMSPSITQRTSLIGSSPHTDWGFLTLILQDNSGGLQVQVGGEWRDLVPCENGILVNCGDYLSLMTGGRYISPLHRVMLHPDRYRASMVFFYYPDYDARLPTVDRDTPLSLLRNQKPDQLGAHLQPGNEPFGEFILHKWEQVFRDAA